MSENTIEYGPYRDGRDESAAKVEQFTRDMLKRKRKGGNGHDTDPPNFELPPIEAYGDEPAADSQPEYSPPSQDHRAAEGDKIELPPLPWERFIVEDFLQPPPDPPFLIAGYHPVDVSTTNGTGGTGKSTLWLYKAIHIILGIPLWDMEILKPGSVVYVTAEDSKDRLKWRLFHVMDQMGLARANRQQVAEHFHIINLVGAGRRLAALDKHGNITITSLADQISEEAQAFSPVAIPFDPMVKFGPGERFPNDAEDAVVNAAMRIQRNLSCAVPLIHHVSKDVMRNGIVDHLSGRGGAALGDGVRAAYQLLGITPDLAKNYPGTELYQSDIAAGRLLALHITKLTDAPRPPEPLILRRNGWLFEPMEMPTQRDVERAIETVRREQAKRNLEMLIAYLKERPCFTPSRNDLESLYQDIGLTRNDLRAAITKGLRVDGALIEVPLPEEKKHGGKQTYIAVAGGNQ